MTRLPCRPRYFLAAIAILVALIALSVLVEAPATDAAPDVFAGAFVIALAWLLVRGGGRARPLALATAAALAVGGLGSVYDGLIDLGLLREVAPALVVGEVALLAGLGLFVYDQVLAGQ